MPLVEDNRTPKFGSRVLGWESRLAISIAGRSGGSVHESEG